MMLICSLMGVLSACTGLNLNAGGLLDSPLSDGATSDDTTDDTATDEESDDESDVDPDADISSDFGQIDFGDDAAIEDALDDVMAVPVSGDEEAAIPDTGEDADVDGGEAGDTGGTDDVVDAGGNATVPDEEERSYQDDNSIWVNPDTGAVETGPTVGKVDDGNTDTTTDDDEEPTSGECEATAVAYRTSTQSQVTQLAMLTSPAGGASAETVFMTMNLQDDTVIEGHQGVQSLLDQRLRTDNSGFAERSGSSRLVVYAKVDRVDVMGSDDEADGDAADGIGTCPVDIDDDASSRGVRATLQIIGADGVVQGSLNLTPDKNGRLISPIIMLSRGQTFAIKLQDSRSPQTQAGRIFINNRGAYFWSLIAKTGTGSAGRLKRVDVDFGPLAQVHLTQSQFADKADAEAVPRISAAKILSQEVSAVAPLTQKGQSLSFSFKSAQVFIKKN